jgi:hypothetical protein
VHRRFPDWSCLEGQIPLSALNNFDNARGEHRSEGEAEGQIFNAYSDAQFPIFNSVKFKQN